MVLTDEELAALGAEDGLILLPHLEALSPEQREAACRTAARGLFLRGLVRGDDTAVVVAPVLVRLLAVRAGAELVACARRWLVPAAPDAEPEVEVHYWHRRGAVVVTESVTWSGHHELHRQGAAGFAGRVAGWLLHPQAAAGAAGGAATAAAALRCADLAVRRPTDGGAAPLLSVLSGPAGTAIVRSTRRAPNAGPGAAPDVRAVDPGEVARTVAALIDGEPAAAAV